MGETNLTELFYGRHSRKCCVHISLFNLTQQWSTVNISISQMSTVRHEETRYFSKLVSGRVGTQTPRWHGPAGHVLLRCRSELASVMRLVIADSWLGASRTWTSPALGAPESRGLWLDLNPESAVDSLQTPGSTIWTSPIPSTCPIFY